MQIFNLDGRTALVTGSSMGIGLALARGLAQAGQRRALSNWCRQSRQRLGMRSAIRR